MEALHNETNDSVNLTFICVLLYQCFSCPIRMQGPGHKGHISADLRILGMENRYQKEEEEEGRCCGRASLPVRERGCGLRTVPRVELHMGWGSKPSSRHIWRHGSHFLTVGEGKVGYDLMAKGWNWGCVHLLVF